MKNKIKGVVKQVCTDFVPKESWFKVRTGKDLQCKNCSTPYLETEGEYVGLMTIEGQPNAHVCSSCAESFKLTGAADIDALRRVEKAKRDAIVARIAELNPRQKTEDESIEKLERILVELEHGHKKELELQEKIKDEYVDVATEQYLIADYQVIESDYLKHELEIEEYFKENGYDYFECGQGYRQDEVDVLVKIGNKFFKVKIEAEIGSSKQDRGDRLYWVEDIERVTYEQVEKPLPKPKDYNLSMWVNVDQYNLVKKFLEERKIEYFTR